MSKREEVLTALFEKLKALDVSVFRNEVLPQKIPPEGMVFLRDGNMGEPEVLLSPPIFIYQHAVELEVIVQDAKAVERDAVLDKILVKIGGLLDDNPTLDGAVDYLHLGSPDFMLEAIEGASAFKAAVVPIILEYASKTSLT